VAVDRLFDDEITTEVI